VDREQRYLTESAGARLALVADSFERLLGRPLFDGAADLWSASLIVLAHGGGTDPAFFYGNRAALDLFEVTAEQLVAMPSRLSAEAGDPAERAALLDQVARQGFIEDYAGVRISATGRRFRIERATVWNLIDSVGAIHGQAAAFDRWVRLD
jgi:hypothetical protein